MKVRDLHYSSVEKYFADVAEWPGPLQSQLLQLSRGGFDFTSTLVDLGGVKLEWNRTGARIRLREVNRGSNLMFGFVLQSPDRVKLRGQELDLEAGVVWQRDEELDYIVPAGLTSLVIHVEAALADPLGWTMGGEVVRPLSKSRLHELEHTCRLATHALSGRDGLLGHADAQPGQLAARWRGCIVEELETVLAPWFTPVTGGWASSPPHFVLMKDAERLLERCDLDRGVTVEYIAGALGVSRRTLFRAFRECLGMGPNAYLRLVKLHQLRRRLLDGLPGDTSVTEVGLELGFAHLGRLSAIYREYFGENPSETLKRA